MRILISGARGLIAGRLAEGLSNIGHQIILISRSDEPIHLQGQNITVSRVDWGSQDSINGVCDEANADAIIHAAGMNAFESASNPIAALEVNGLITARLAAAISRSRRLIPFIYFSSIHVYSSSLSGIITEDDCPLNLHPYATSHEAGEKVLLSISQTSKIRPIILRLSNAIGPPIMTGSKCWSLIANDLCRQAVTTGKMIIQDNPQTRRDFIAIKEVVRVVNFLLRSECAAKGIFNLGSEKTITIQDLADLIQGRANHLRARAPAIIYMKEKIETEKFYYKNHRLMGYGLKVDSDLTDEIDALLRFCDVHYKTFSEE